MSTSTAGALGTSAGALNTTGLANGAAESITGLASNLDTGAIISSIIAIDEAPVNMLQLQEDGLSEQSSQLSSIQTALQSLSTSAAGIQSPSLFTTTQNVTSTNDAISGTAINAVGAPIGSYQIAVTQLAASAQRTFSFASPSSADTVTIDGQNISLAAGASAQDLADAINSNNNVDVYASTTSDNTLVLSNRATGDTGTNFIQVSDTQSALTQVGSGTEGADAVYTVNGAPGSSSSNTTTTAIAGVSLDLGALTGASAATVTVGAPTPNTTSIVSAVQSFVSLYNSTLSSIQSQLTQPPVLDAQTESDAQQGTLYQDQGLSDLVNQMRTLMYTPDSSLTEGTQDLADVGITTGAPVGDGTVSQSSLAGDLTVNTATLTAAIESNPTGVQTMLQGWANSFQTLVNASSAPGGELSNRINGDASQVSDLSNQISSMNEMIQVKQSSLETEYATLESTLSASQQQGSWLSSQISSLSANG